jgi:hypothetical protein
VSTGSVYIKYSKTLHFVEVFLFTLNSLSALTKLHVESGPLPGSVIDLCRNQERADTGTPGKATVNNGNAGFCMLANKVFEAGIYSVVPFQGPFFIATFEIAAYVTAFEEGSNP